MKHAYYILLLFFTLACATDQQEETTDVAKTINVDSLKEAKLQLVLPTSSTAEDHMAGKDVKVVGQAIDEKTLEEVVENIKEETDTIIARVDQSIFAKEDCCPDFFSTSNTKKKECCCNNIALKFNEMKDAAQRVNIKTDDVFFGNCKDAFDWFEDKVTPKVGDDDF